MHMSLTMDLMRGWSRAAWSREEEEKLSACWSLPHPLRLPQRAPPEDEHQEEDSNKSWTLAAAQTDPALATT